MTDLSLLSIPLFKVWILLRLRNSLPGGSFANPLRLLFCDSSGEKPPFADNGGEDGGGATGSDMFFILCSHTHRRFTFLRIKG